MLTIDPKAIPVGEMFSYLTSSVVPRPIAFVSSIDQEGKVNLSPFSFFNVFGANPPTLVFSPSKRVRDNTDKHTLENVLEVPEVVISMVNYSMVEQMSLASTEYDKGVNEFVKAGFSEAPSQQIQPPRVAEAPVSFECLVKQVLPMGTGGGSGNLVICEVVLMHIQEHLLDPNGQIDPFLFDAVARLGGSWYSRAGGNALFQVAKPGRKHGVGIDQLPAAIRHSTILSGNDLARLGSLHQLPGQETIEQYRQQVLKEVPGLAGMDDQQRHQLAKSMLGEGKVLEAFAVLS